MQAQKPMTQEQDPSIKLPRPVLRDIPPGNFYVGPGTKIEVEFGNQERILNLEEGAFPFPPTEKIQGILNEINGNGELLNSILEYGSVSNEPFIRNIQTLLEIEGETAEKVYIVGSGGGQDEIIERSITQTVDYMSVVIAPAPFYPHVANFAERNFHMPLAPVERPLGEPFEDAVRETIEDRKLLHQHQAGYDEEAAFVFLNTPCSPTGETVSYDLIEKLVQAGDRKDPNDPDDSRENDIIYIDLGLGLDLELARKLVKLAAKHSNVIIGFSIPSKELGVANLRFGFAVMSKAVGEVYEKARRIMDIPGHTQLIMNRLSDPDIVIPQLKKREEITVYWKEKFMFVLDKLNEGAPFKVERLLTDPRSLVMTLTSKDENLYNKMAARNIETAKGSAWRSTHSEMTDAYVRIRPPMNEEDFNEFFRRLYLIVHNIGANRDQSEGLFRRFMESISDYSPPPVFEG